MTGKSILSQPTLVLNRSWQAICTTTVRHAIVLAYNGRAKIIATDTYELHDFQSWADLSTMEETPVIHSVCFSIPAPEVLLLTNTNVYPQPRVVFSRRNIFKRDRYTCQYCGARPPVPELTIDHIIPRSKKGRSTWENCVVSCRQCNERKGNRTPDHPEVDLRVKPKRPLWLPFVTQNTKFPASWEKFVGELYWNVELDQSGD